MQFVQKNIEQVIILICLAILFILEDITIGYFLQSSNPPLPPFAKGGRGGIYACPKEFLWRFFMQRLGKLVTRNSQQKILNKL
jgi:hypothetical protein